MREKDASWGFPALLNDVRILKLPKMPRPALLSSMICLFLGASVVRAADWPAWGGKDLGRNMVSPEKGLPDDFKPGEKSPMGDGMLPGSTKDVRWVMKLGTLICGNPTVAAGRVFIGSDDSSLQGDSRLK